MRKVMRKYIKDSVIYRETRRIVHDKNIFLLVLLAPILYVFFYGSVYINNTVRSVEMGVIDNDQSSLSRLYKQYLHADPMLRIHNYQNTKQAEDDLQKQKIIGYVVLPPNFEQHIKKGLKTRYAVYISASSFMPANEASKRILLINQTLSTQIEAKYFMSKGYSKASAISASIPIRTDVNSLGNSVYGYANFVLVGLFLLILHQLMLIGMSESVALEFQEKTVNEWYSRSNSKLFKMLTGKALPYLCFFYTYYIFYLTLPFSFCHLHQKGDYLELVLLSIPFFIVVAELALLLGSFFKSKLQALQVLALTSIPIIIGSGFAWPFYALSLPLKILSSIMPFYPMVMAFQTMTQLGASLGQQMTNWLWLWALAVFYGILVWIRYKRVVVIH